jgi:hypothetical protein
MSAYLQQEANELKKRIASNIGELFARKRLLGFYYRNQWQSNDDFLIAVDYIEPANKRKLLAEFSFELSALFQEEPDDCASLDENAGLTGKALNRIDRALLRILYIIFVGCSALERDLQNWKEDPLLRSVGFQVDRDGQMEAYFRY